MPAFPHGANKKGGRNAAPVLAQMAREFYAPIIPVVMELHNKGLSLREIGRELDRRGIRTRMVSTHWFTGVSDDGELLSDMEINKWGPAQVRRALIRGHEEERAAATASATKSPIVIPAPKALVAKAAAAPAAKALPEPAPKAPDQKAPSAHTAPAKFRLWIGGQAKGPFSEAQVKAELAAGRITLETNCNRIGESTWQPLRKLFGAPIDAAPVTTAKVGYGSVARPGLQNL